VATDTPAATVTSAATVTATTEPPRCFYNWAQQDLPDLSKQIQAAMDAAGITGAEAIAGAFGEDNICLDAQGKETTRTFSAMETDFYITLHVPDFADREALGNLLDQVLAVLEQFPPDKTPGPQPGRIAITFAVGEQKHNLSFTITEAADARRRGLKGAALLEALRY
jgi:hypothetical protein